MSPDDRRWNHEDSQLCGIWELIEFSRSDEEQTLFVSCALKYYDYIIDSSGSESMHALHAIEASAHLLTLSGKGYALYWNWIRRQLRQASDDILGCLFIKVIRPILEGSWHDPAEWPDRYWLYSCLFDAKIEKNLMWLLSENDMTPEDVSDDLERMCKEAAIKHMPFPGLFPREEAQLARAVSG